MIIEYTVMDAWKKALEEVLKEGASFKDFEGRICKEMMNLTITILNPSKDIRKPVNELSKLKKLFREFVKSKIQNLPPETPPEISADLIF